MRTANKNDPYSQAIADAAAATKRGDFDEAIDILKQVVAQKADHELAHGMLASLYAELKLWDRATDQYNRVLALSPDNPLARLQLGLVLISQNRQDDALRTLEPLTHQADDFIAGYYSAVALMALGRPQEARPLLERAARNVPAGNPVAADIGKLLAAISDN